MHPGDAEENVIFILQLNSKSPLSALEQNPDEIEGSGERGDQCSGVGLQPFRPVDVLFGVRLARSSMR